MPTEIKARQHISVLLTHHNFDATVFIVLAFTEVEKETDTA